MKAKLHPGALAALILVAVFVTGEAAVISRQAERAGSAWLAGVRATATREFAAFIVKSVTCAVARGAKS